MAETELIRKMADDVAALKEQMSRIEVAINEIDMDIMPRLVSIHPISWQF